MKKILRLGHLYCSKGQFILIVRYDGYVNLSNFDQKFSKMPSTVFPRIVSAETILFEFNLMYCDLWLQYIQARKLFKGGNYSRAETIYEEICI